MADDQGLGRNKIGKLVSGTLGEEDGPLCWTKLMQTAALHPCECSAKDGSAEGPRAGPRTACMAPVAAGAAVASAPAPPPGTHQMRPAATATAAGTGGADACQGELMPPENSCPVNTEPEKPIPPPLLPSGRFFCVTCLPPSHMTRRQKSKLSSANLRDGAPLPGPRTPRSPGIAKSPYGFLSQPTTLILGRLELRHNQAAS